MKLRHLTTSAMALILMSACTDATGVEVDDLAGTWVATAIVFTSVEDPAMTVDITEEGATATFTLDAEGAYTVTFVFGEENEVETGTYAVDGNVLTLTDSVEGAEVWDVARDGDTMTLTSDDDEFDFDDDQVEDPASLVITLAR